MTSNIKQEWKSLEGDPDSRVILARRKMLIALALTGATSLGFCGCTKSISLTTGGSDTVDAGRTIFDSESGFAFDSAGGTDSGNSRSTDSAAAWDTGTETAWSTDDTAASDTASDTSTAVCGCGCNGCGGCGCGCGSA